MDKKELIPYIVVVAVFAIILNFVILIGSIKSGSMEETVKTGDIVIGNKLAYITHSPQRGNIIFFIFKIKFIVNVLLESQAIKLLSVMAMYTSMKRN